MLTATPIRGACTELVGGVQRCPHPRALPRARVRAYPPFSFPTAVSHQLPRLKLTRDRISNLRDLIRYRRCVCGAVLLCAHVHLLTHMLVLGHNPARTCRAPSFLPSFLPRVDFLCLPSHAIEISSFFSSQNQEWLKAKTVLGDSTQCYYALLSGKNCADDTQSGVYLISRNWCVTSHSSLCSLCDWLHYAFARLVLPLSCSAKPSCSSSRGT